MFDFLKNKNKWSKDVDLNAFINAYVLEHAKNKDGVQMSMITTQIGNPTGIKEVYVVENIQKKEGSADEEKSPEDIAKTAKKLMAEQIETNQMQTLLRASQPAQAGQGLAPAPAEKPKSIAEAYMEYKMMKDIMKEGEAEIPSAVTAKLSRLEEKIDKMAEEAKTEKLVAPLERELKSLREEIKAPSKTNDWKEFMQIVMTKDKETAEAVSEVQLRLEEERNKFVETQMADLKARVNQGVQGAGLEKQMMDKITPVIAAAFDEKLAAVKGEVAQPSNAAVAKDLITSVLSTFQPTIQEYAKRRGMGPQQPAGEAPPPGAIQITEEELNMIRQKREDRAKRRPPAPQEEPKEEPKGNEDPFIRGPV